MLLYELEIKTENTWVYVFYPEGNRTAPGRVKFDIFGNRKVLDQSEDDFKGYYAGHAMSGIDKSKEFGTVAWC